MAPALCDPFSAPRVGPGTARAGDMAQPGKVRCDPGTSAAPLRGFQGPPPACGGSQPKRGQGRGLEREDSGQRPEKAEPAVLSV